MSIHNTIFNLESHEYKISEMKITDNQNLKWNYDLGIGFLNPNPDIENFYQKEYWDSYRKLIDTDMGKSLTKARIDIAKKFEVKPLRLIDVGIGNGQFVDTFGCYGSDINPYAIEYLKHINRFYNPLKENFKWQWMSMWDVIEHFEDASQILSKCNNLMLSTPVYTDLTDILSSKHFKPNEHLWYFTISGLIHYMNYYGFDCKYYSTIESKLGRHNIGSFVFRRN